MSCSAVLRKQGRGLDCYESCGGSGGVDRMLRYEKRQDDECYIAGWIAIGAAAWLAGILVLTRFRMLALLRPCALHALTGLYCPGCGGTRAVLAFLRGDLLRSLFYHPIVPYTAVVCGWFMASQTIERVSRGRIRIGMHVRELYLWLALLIIAINFLLKNLALLVWHVDLLA